MEIITLIIGLVVGLIVAGLFLKKRISDAESIAQGKALVELALLNERLTATTEEAKRLNSELTESEQQREAQRLQLEAARNECAQLTERATRLPVLEQELKDAQAQIDGQNQQLSSLQQKLSANEATLASQGQEVTRLMEESRALTARRDQLLADLQKMNTEFAELSTTLDAERRQNEEKLALLNEAREQLSNQFKALASEILEEKAKRFTEQNQTNIGQLLEPLKVKLNEFQGKVEEVYVKEGQERSALAQQVKHLMDLNRKLSDDAHNLTNALKGSSKTRGNWGEMILEKILESSGLRKGYEYDAQESHTRDDGSRAQPDVIIHLPEERHIIVDAKVTLNAYEEYVNAEDDTDRDLALKRYVASVRGHIKELSDKNYHDIHGVKSLDFVLMFIPIESAFMLAISQDNNLWEDSWNKNVMLVSPSTLLFVVRTVAHLWRQEQQNRNAQDIARRGAELYDKLVGFVEDLKGVGNRIKQAQTEYDKAYGKFVDGRGNVIRQAEMLKGLGVKPSKSMPVDVLDVAIEETPLLSAD
ncbi:DNA recombination protein RmuC [Geobacter sp. 60473]|uniref:DNA recombination protein RmuC n=1 Tax=Geobacter sp. 60473 TaxID=3080755 RepID=UPI002B2A9AF7|nr:DNA recombination protein RmuC [Geobacter sp. 60473]